MAEETDQPSPEAPDPGVGSGGATPEGREWIIDGLPAEFHADTPAGTVQALHGRVAELAEKLGEYTVPGEGESYGYEPTEKVLHAFGGKDSGIFAAVEAAAKKVGTPTAHFGPFVEEVVSQLFEGGLVVDPMAEARAILGEKFSGSDADVAAAAGARFDEMSSWLDSLGKQAGIGGDSLAALKGLTDRAVGFKALEALKSHMARRGVVVGGEAVPAGMTKAQLDARVADPRNDHRAREFDPAFQKETMRLFQQLYGH